jgi:alpha-galactosidase
MRAELKNDLLILSTGVVEYGCRWNEGHLIGLYLEQRDGARWELAGTASDCEFPGQVVPPADGRLEVSEQAATAIIPAHLRVEVYTRLDTLEVKRVFRLFPDCPMIGCRIELRGTAKGLWRKARTSDAAQVNIESEDLAWGRSADMATLHRVMAPHQHLEIECAQFFDVTDYRNNLVQTLAVEPYVHPVPLHGNVLLARDRLNDRGLVLLKEAPCSDVQLASPGFDFLSCGNQIQIVGPGLDPEDVSPAEWVPGYGFAFGAAGRDTFALLSALHDYQRRLRVHEPKRDAMIMLNTWGDRGEARGMCEAWVMKEIEAGARLGVTHFQLDHGWETTQHQDVAWPPNFKRIWDTPWFWDVNPKRFPNGLGPCVEAARRAGIELCLWFNPAPEDSYVHWQDDANTMIRLYRQCGIRTFKIDFVQIPDKLAERNLRRMLDTVLEATGQQAVFNLDVTAGRRFGYFDFTEYGNKFLENRYTDWSNYYPHWALRNLWMLSRYVPSRTLQVEFLNKWRNQEKYAADDPLAPSKVPFDYIFAVTMAAQPLAWFEACNLPPEAFEIAGLVRIYREHQSAFQGGTVLPIGESPCGTGWTGFQSCGAKNGYFLVFRELNQRPEAALASWLKPGQRVQCRCLAGQGTDFDGKVDAEGRVTFRLPHPFSFGLYRYEV